MKARYPICSISTTEIEMVARAQAINARGYTWEQILLAGVEALEKKELDITR